MSWRASTALVVSAGSILLTAGLASSSRPVAQTPQSRPADPFIAKLLPNRYALSVRNGQLSGAGAPVLKAAIAESRFVLLGEYHGLAQTPEFLAAVCTTAGAGGLILSRVLARPLGTRARLAMQQLLERNNEDSRKAVETGRISDQFMIAADDRELADGTALLLNDGSSEARFMAAGSATTSRNSPKGRPLDPCLLAVNGSQPIFPRVGQPAQLRPFNLEDDPGFRYLQPMFGNLLQTDWTMFDLRPLRQQFNRAGAMTADLAAFVFGYDIPGAGA